jgi:membrane fusion protein, multidrug efflux system
MQPFRCGPHCAVIALFALSACSSFGPAPKTVGAASSPVIPVEMATAETRLMPVEIKTIGNIEAITTITVKSQIGGALLKVNFHEGDMVQKGDPLFEIDPRPYQESVRQLEANLARDKAMLAQTEASLGRAQAEQEHAERQRERYDRLASEGIFSHEQADQIAVDARTRRATVQVEAASIESARASVRATEAALDNAKLNLSYCTIKSPITGRTGSLRIQEGNLVKANDVDLVVIHQVAPIYVAFSVPEDRLLALRDRLNGGPLRVRAAIPGDRNEPAAGTISFLDNAVDTTTGTIRLKATFDNASSRLWPGQFVDVYILIEERPNAVVIPASAVQTGQSGNFVYVVKQDDTVEIRPVTPGPRADRIVSIEHGLKAGERVVTEGQLRVAPGMKVRVAS